MNEGLSVYLNLDVEKLYENEELIERIDELLLTVGMKYSGFQNMYLPAERENRDHAVYAACKLLRQTEWLKGILAYTMIANLTNACPLRDILTDHMKEPSPEKMKYYETYYLSSGRLAHSIIVDENRQLRDGYTSYLLAVKYDLRPDISEALSGQPLRKIVTGRHVEFTDEKWKIKDSKYYRWAYTIDDSVVPGDILQVSTRNGLSFIRTDKIDYATGKEFCREHRSVKRHIGMALEI